MDTNSKCLISIFVNANSVDVKAIIYLKMKEKYRHSGEKTDA